MRAEDLFQRARELLAREPVYEYPIELYLKGLNLEPDNVVGHRELRELALRRRAAGGKGMGLIEIVKVTADFNLGSDDKAKMLAAEKLLTYEPAKRKYMLQVLRHAHAGGFVATQAWIRTVLGNTRP